MYKIWDKLKQEYISPEKSKLLLHPLGYLVKIGFGTGMKKVNNDRFLIQNYIQINDDSNVPIFEGDIINVTYVEHIENENKEYEPVTQECICVVSFVDEIGSYVLLDITSGSKQFWCFSNQIKTKVLGNVTVNPEYIKDPEILKTLEEIHHYDGDNTETNNIETEFTNIVLDNNDNTSPDKEN